MAAHSDLAIPPGEYLEEVIGELGMTKDELATRMARPATKLSQIFKGEKAITADTALQLEKVVGVPAHIWLGLESEYRLSLVRQEKAREQELLKAEVGLVDSFCYPELVKLGAVARHSHPIDKVMELQRFFGVATLHSVLEVRRYQAAFRCGKSPKQGHSCQAAAAWLRMGEIKARGIVCAPFNKSLLQESLMKIRAMTLQTPDQFLTPLSEILASAGVALVVCPHFPGTKAHGATFWLGREKAVLLLTIRGKWADIFWFSLFHEIGHILLHDRQSVFLEDDCAAPEQAEQEAAADRFAADTLIPPKVYEHFLKQGIFTPYSVHGFADVHGIDAGIVVGRLQHDGRLKHEWNNDLRKRYEWT
ncbi:MAG TPA: HigA family addiction module antitoxin [bacterium]